MQGLGNEEKVVIVILQRTSGNLISGRRYSGCPIVSAFSGASNILEFDISQECDLGPT